MTKAEIVQALYTRVGGFSKKESADIVDMVFEMMKETLGRGEKIKISGFGNFVLRDKRQRPGRNPQTGDPIKISERRVLTFKASQILKQALNPKHVGLIDDEDDDDDDDDVSSDGAADGAPKTTTTSSNGNGSAHAAPTPLAASPVASEITKE
ncbi:MAG: integration host factor subunit alpha [Labilithrix sp.]